MGQGGSILLVTLLYDLCCGLAIVGLMGGVVSRNNTMDSVTDLQPPTFESVKIVKISQIRRHCKIETSLTSYLIIFMTAATPKL